MEFSLDTGMGSLHRLAHTLTSIPEQGPVSPQDRGREDRAETCIANISPAERRKRLIAGVIPFVLALGILALLVSSGADRLWRLPLILLFWSATTGFFQWRDKT